MDIAAPLQAQIRTHLASIATILTASDQTTVPNLIHGKLGHALFLGYYHLLTNNDTYLDAAAELLEESMQVASTTDQLSALGTGFTGLCWLIEHFVKLELLDPETRLITTGLRPELIQGFEVDLRRREYDLLYGFIGKLVYFTESNPEDFTAQYAQALAYLRTAAVPVPAGVYWAAPDQDSINLGLAHGSPSILLALLRLSQHADFSAADQALLTAGLDYLLAQQRGQPTGSLYPASAAADPAAASSSRLAWCYGDLGIAFTLLYAARHFSPAYQAAGEQAAQCAAARLPAAAGVVFRPELSCYDVGWCHGTAGIAHLFHQVAHLAPHLPALTGAYQHWLELTVANLTPYLAGFSTLDKRRQEAHQELSWEIETSLLEGLAGVGLMLITALRPDLNRWNQLFLVDLPDLTS